MSETSSIILGAGCFWCVEAIFSELRGIHSVIPGYAGGQAANPSYEEVYTDKTDHAEVVKITFDAQEISLEDLLRVFFTTHDPTQRNRQGNDTGTRYRSVIFGNAAQQEVAHKIRDEITGEALWPAPIVTNIEGPAHFWPAEEYHHNYFARNPNQAYCTTVIAPKLARARKIYRKHLKNPV